MADYVRYYVQTKQSYGAIRGFYLTDNTPKTTYQDIYVVSKLFERFGFGTLIGMAEEMKLHGTPWEKDLIRQIGSLAGISKNALAKYNSGFRTASSDENRKAWSAISKMAIQLGGESVTPSKIEYAKEAVVESIKDRVEDFKDALKLVPKAFDWISNIIKWGAIGIAAYFGLQVVSMFQKEK